MIEIMIYVHGITVVHFTFNTIKKEDTMVGYIP